MPIPEHLRETVERFFAGIEPFLNAYTDSCFSYVAVKRGTEFSLIKGTLVLSMRPVPIKRFASHNVRAQHYPLEAVAPSLKAFLEVLFQGNITTPDDHLLFPGNNGSYLARYTPFHEAGLQGQSRTNVLTVAGSPHSIEQHQPGLDWELKAAAIPYDNLQELIGDYGLGVLQSDVALVEVIAGPVALVDASSAVEGKHARLRVRLAKGLDTDKFALGYRLLRTAQVAERKRITGANFEWDADANAQVGSTELEVAEGDILHCITSYEGLAQSFYWLADHSTTQNARRASYEAFDPQLQTLRAIISGASSPRGRDARELEAAVAWILWMLGFSVVHLGGTTRMQDAADLLVTTPLGHVGVIECTTGLLKAENKLAHLHERAQAVRRALDASGSRHLRLLTAIVTSKPRSDVEVDLEQAERLGIWVQTREDLDRAVDRTLIPQNAEQLFEQAEQAVKYALARHTPVLPGIPGV